jgi:hypothetical protein
MEKKHKYKSMSFHLSDDARALLAAYAAAHGLTRTAALELLLRLYAKEAR